MKTRIKKKNKFPKLKRYRFPNPFLGIMLVIGPEKEAIKYQEWFFDGAKIKNLSGTGGDKTNGKTLFVPGYELLIWLPHKPKDIYNLGSLVHECLHATFYVAQFLNLKYKRTMEETNEEFFT